MNYYDLPNATLIVAKDGATVSCISPEGEVLWAEGLRMGRHDAAQWLPLMGPNDTLSLGGAVTALVREPVRLRSQSMGDAATESGANPDFVVTSASRHERELDRKLNIITQRSDVLERRIASINKLAELKAVPVEVAKGEDVEVIDKDDEPTEAVNPPIIEEDVDVTK